MTRGRRARSLRARLADKELPSITYNLRVADPAAAERNLHAAASAHRDVLIANDDLNSAAVRLSKRRLAAAEQAVADCYEPLVLRAIEPDLYEKLRDKHPPTEEQRADGDMWNAETLRAPLIAATVVDDDPAEDPDAWWSDFLSTKASSGERESLFGACLAVNEAARVSDPVVLPKGLPMTRS